MATSERFLDRLNELLQLDHAAVDAYEQAIRRVQSAFVREKLREFQDDHRRHVDALGALIARYGGRPQSLAAVAARLTLVSGDGDEQALTALLRTERETNDTYRADDRALPDDVRHVILHQRSDESRHLDWINRALAQRLWEEGAPLEHP